MKCEYVTKNFEVSPHLSRIIDEKLSKLDHLLPNGASGKVRCEKESNLYKMSIDIKSHSSVYRAEGTSNANMFEIIDVCLPKIERQIIKDKEKKQHIK